MPGGYLSPRLVRSADEALASTPCLAANPDLWTKARILYIYFMFCGMIVSDIKLSLRMHAYHPPGSQ